MSIFLSEATSYEAFLRQKNLVTEPFTILLSYRVVASSEFWILISNFSQRLPNILYQMLYPKKELCLRPYFLGHIFFFGMVCVLAHCEPASVTYSFYLTFNSLSGARDVPCIACLNCCLFYCYLPNHGSVMLSSLSIKLWSFLFSLALSELFSSPLTLSNDNRGASQA